MRSDTRTRRAGVGLVTAVAVGAAALAGLATAEAADEQTFDHVGTFNVPANLPAGVAVKTPTSAEIVDATPDGRTLVYTDAPQGVIGFIGIADPANPSPGGMIDVGGEPTSVALFRQWALVAVNTSPSYTEPSGELVVVNTLGRTIVKRIPLAGQPDSIDISPDERWAAVVIENERDEELEVEGVEGALPQDPPGVLQVVDLQGGPGAWKRPRTVELAGLEDMFEATDPEPEYVDINAGNQAVVSLQENNHLAIVDLPSATVVEHFSAGSVALNGIDATEEGLGPQENGLIVQDESLTKRREPDAVAWVDANTFATANEGDYEDANGDEGGSRGFTLFNVDGTVEYESGASFEREIARIGHYPEGRSENKGNEPEGVEVGVFGDRTLLFVGAERANVVGVFDVTDGSPEPTQLLPTGIGPEGIKAIPSRGLLAVSAEVDGQAEEDPGDRFDVRSLVTLYELGTGAASYPYLRSDDEGGVPIPWVAISGLAGDPSDADTLWAVSDSFLAQAYVYEIDTSSGRGVIVNRIPVGGIDVDNLDGDFDLEGIAAREEGGFWLASEGQANPSSRPNLIVRVGDDGSVVQSVPLPTTLVAQQTGSGFEGIAVTGTTAENDEVVWIAIQREWKDDPAGVVKLGRYDVAAAEWAFARYPLDGVASPNGGWVGLSELTVLPNGKLAVVERDNQLGLDARIKKVYAVDPGSVTWVEHASPQVTPLPTLTKTLLRDMLPELDAASISVPDKLEGLGLTGDGRVFVATDNDGVDENYGETLFFETSLG